MNVQIDISCDTPAWPEDIIRRLATFALEFEKAPMACEVSISLISTDEIAELNERYRERSGPTDVLSFPCDDPWKAKRGVPVIPIGDIMIAPEVAAKQAPEFGNTFDDEMSLLLVHGCLHLLGYDHIDDGEAEEMERHEREILAAWRAENS